jgi:glutamate--cysteine ligase
VPTTDRRLTLANLESHVRDEVFCDRHDQQVGIELEWLTFDRDDPSRRPDLTELTRLAADTGPQLPRDGYITIEPGGQLELSTQPHPDAESACQAAADDLFVLERHARAEGYELVALGADPVRAPYRIVTEPRYRSMQRYFDLENQAGLAMMTNTASIQLNLGFGHDPARLAERWRLANRLAPVLTACFANSPLIEGRSTGWLSSRQRTWTRIDPTRTRPVPLGPSPQEAWLQYALDANVMLVRRGEDDYVAITDDLPFGRWLAEGHELGWPTLADWDYHLTTLFPPVRPRGWFELRTFDALPTPFWHVAVSVVAQLLDSVDAAAEATEALDGLDVSWQDAAQLGLAHPDLARVASALFEISLTHIERHLPDSATASVVAAYHDRWVAQGRTPADDRLDQWRATGELLPPSESPVRYVEFDAATS